MVMFVSDRSAVGFWRNMRTTSDMPSSGVKVIQTMPLVALVRVKTSV